MAKMKWEIKGLTSELTLKKAARKVMSKRIKSLEKAISEYLINGTPEELHSIRIAVRRLRYNMELFISCFPRNKFVIFYDKIANLQDVTGKIRDIDILLFNLNSLDIEAASKSKKTAVSKIERNNNQLREELKILLSDYLSSKELNEFIYKIK